MSQNHPDHSTRYFERAFIDEPTFLSVASAESPSPFDPDYHLVMTILGQRKAKGGFSVDDMLAAELGLDLQGIVSGSRDIMPYSENENLCLLWSAVPLHVLEQHFPKHRKSWEKAVKKGLKWVEKKIKKQKSTIRGEPLMSWAAR